MSGQVKYRLVASDRNRLAQFSEYDVLLDGICIGQVSGGVVPEYRKARNGGFKRLIGERYWSGTTLDGRGTGLVATRAEAVRDLLRVVA